jgi:hypothetical protein
MLAPQTNLASGSKSDPDVAAAPAGRGSTL